jgi:hypothetical protein
VWLWLDCVARKGGRVGSVSNEGFCVFVHVGLMLLLPSQFESHAATKHAGPLPPFLPSRPVSPCFIGACTQ